MRNDPTRVVQNQVTHGKWNEFARDGDPSSHQALFHMAPCTSSARSSLLSVNGVWYTVSN